MFNDKKCLVWSCCLFGGAIIMAFIFAISHIGHLVIAMTGLVFGSFIFAVLAMLIAIFTRSHSKASFLILAGLATVVSGVLSLFVVAVFVDARYYKPSLAKKTSIEPNMKLLHETLMQYAMDNAGCLPYADSWCDDLIKFSNNLTIKNFQHPLPSEFKLKKNCHIAFNSNLSGLAVSEISNNTVLLFFADGEWNLAGTSKLLKKRYENQRYVPLILINGDLRDYWFEHEKMKDFMAEGHSMVYKEPQWEP